MAWIKKTAVGLVAVALLVGAGAAIYVQRTFAVVDGKIVENLHIVTAKALIARAAHIAAIA